MTDKTKLTRHQEPIPVELDEHTFPIVGTAYELDHCTECGKHISKRREPCTAAKTNSTP